MPPTASKSSASKSSASKAPAKSKAPAHHYACPECGASSSEPFTCSGTFATHGAPIELPFAVGTHPGMEAEKITAPASEEDQE